MVFFPGSREAVETQVSLQLESHMQVQIVQSSYISSAFPGPDNTQSVWNTICTDKLGTTRSTASGNIVMTSDTPSGYIFIRTKQRIWWTTDTSERYTWASFTSRTLEIVVGAERLQSGLVAATKDSLCEA